MIEYLKNEKIVLRGELDRVLTSDEVDSNFITVQNNDFIVYNLNIDSARLQLLNFNNCQSLYDAMGADRLASLDLGYLEVFYIDDSNVKHSNEGVLKLIDNGSTYEFLLDSFDAGSDFNIEQNLQTLVIPDASRKLVSVSFVVFDNNLSNTVIPDFDFVITHGV